MTDDAGRTTPGGSDPAQPPPRPYTQNPPYAQHAHPPSPGAPQPGAQHPYPPYPVQPYEVQPYPVQPYPVQGFPPSQFPPQPYPPEAYPPETYPPPHPPQTQRQQPAPGYPPSQYPPPAGPAQGYPPQAGPAQGYPPQARAALPQPGQAYPPPPYPARVPGGRRPTGLVVGGLAGVLALAAVGVGVVALRGSGDGGNHQAAPVSGPAVVTPDPSTSLTPATETPAGQTPAPDPSTPDPSATEPSGASSPSPAASPSSRIGSSVALSKGDCIQALPKGQNILTVTLVPCTSPHEAQVGSTFSPKGATYPGGSALEEIVRSECPIRLGRAISADAPELSWTGYYPEAVEWEGGDHSVKCLVIARNGKPLTRSVIR